MGIYWQFGRTGAGSPAGENMKRIPCANSAPPAKGGRYLAGNSPRIACGYFPKKRIFVPILSRSPISKIKNISHMLLAYDGIYYEAPTNHKRVHTFIRKTATNSHNRHNRYGK